MAKRVRTITTGRTGHSTRTSHALGARVEIRVEENAVFLDAILDRDRSKGRKKESIGSGTHNNFDKDNQQGESYEGV
jgi:hypothetical protein